MLTLGMSKSRKNTLGVFGASLGLLRGPFEPLLVPFGVLLGHFGGPWAPLGITLEHFGVIWVRFGSLLGYLESHMEILGII